MCDAHRLSAMEVESKSALLLAAAEQGNVEEISKLMSNGKDSDNPEDIVVGDRSRRAFLPFRCPLGYFGESTALMVSAKNGHVNCVRKLLEIGGKVYIEGIVENRQYGAGERKLLPREFFGAMVVAASEGHFECVQALAEHRYFNDRTDDSPYTDFITTARCGDFQSVPTLMNAVHGDAIFRGWKGHNLMCLFLLYGCPPSCVQAMIDHGIGVNGWDFNGLTPLMCAVIGKNLECVKFLIDHGADVYVQKLANRSAFRDDGTIDFDDESLHLSQPTSLAYAAGVSDVPILKLMLESAPDDIARALGKLESLHFPLEFAVCYGNFDSVSLILDVTAARQKITCHTIALGIIFADIEVLKLLLENIGYSGNYHKIESQIDFLSDHGDCHALIKIMMTAHEDTNSHIISLFLKLSICHERPSHFDSLFRHFNNEISRQGIRNHLLHECVTFFSIGCARILLKNGVSVNSSESHDRKTALMVGCCEGKDESVQFLIT